MKKGTYLSVCTLTLSESKTTDDIINMLGGENVSPTPECDWPINSLPDDTVHVIGEDPLAIYHVMASADIPLPAMLMDNQIWPKNSVFYYFKLMPEGIQEPEDQSVYDHSANLQKV